MNEENKTENHVVSNVSEDLRSHRLMGSFTSSEKLGVREAKRNRYTEKA